MAPEKLFCMPQNPYNSPEEDTGDEDHDGGYPDDLECLFQVERLQQAADDSTSNSGEMRTVYILRPATLWDSLTEYWTFNSKSSLILYALSLTNMMQ